MKAHSQFHLTILSNLATYITETFGKNNSVCRKNKTAVRYATVGLRHRKIKYYETRRIENILTRLSRKRQAGYTQFV